MQDNRLLVRLTAILLVVLAAGCAGQEPRLDAAPPNTYATPVGFHGIRYWGDSELKKLDAAIAERRAQLAIAAKADPTINLKHADYLAISGGGSVGSGGWMFCSAGCWAAAPEAKSNPTKAVFAGIQRITLPQRPCRPHK